MLTEIFNHTLSIGYHPNNFKTPIIKMILKEYTNHVQPINYRPMSLLEVPGKILENIVNKRLINPLESENKPPCTQHGFRHNRGTDTALTVIHETIAHHISLTTKYT